MAAIVKNADQLVFGLDIGTRSIVGTVGYMDSNGFHIVAMDVKEHDTRAMLDGQVHDIGKVAEEIMYIKTKLESKLGVALNKVCIAAAGRVLKTITVSSDNSFDEEKRVDKEDIYNLDFSAVEIAHRMINEQEDNVNYYCVGYTPVKYYVNDYEITNIEGHKASKISVELLATFLPEDVVDGLYASVEAAELEVANLTLEPIAAMNVAIPEQYRLLNISLVDVGAGTSDICITRDGSVVAYGMLPHAGDEITEVIAKHFLVDFATAEKIKMDAGTTKKVIQFKDIMGLKQTTTPKEVKQIAKDVVDRITGGVADRICELNGDKPVSAVFVVGGGGKIPGFCENLAKCLGLPKERVAIRGKEVLENIDFAIDNIKKDSLYVTPVGICINYYNQKNNFIYVTVNGERIKLYDNSRLTVIDAIMQAGYPNDKLFPKRGNVINYTLNGQARMIRGEAGEPAKIFRNGKPVSLNSEIEKNDYIDIEESTAGECGKLTIGELPELKSTISFSINGKNIVCPRYAYVNGTIENNDYEIKAKDKIVMENYYSLQQLFEFLDVDLETVAVVVNNMPADKDTKVYENFTVEYVDVDKITSFDELPEDNTTEYKAQDKPAKKKTQKAKQTHIIKLTVNGNAVELSGKDKYIMVDVMDAIHFDVREMKGSDIVTNINGIKAEFSDEVNDADTIEIYWSDK